MTAAPLLSVTLCAHNPREDFLQATLDSLHGQDLPADQWELIVVDNHSHEPLAGRIDVSWHPAARIVVENQLGLANARRHGYLESRGALVIHSDDDNVFAPDYLRRAVTIHREYPHLGTFGGQLMPRFEVEPRNELERRFGEERRFTLERWSNLIDDSRYMPWGAGMCLRREVIDAYLAEVSRDPRRLTLGRTGARLLTGEDLDLNYVAVKHGYGTGLFPALQLEHFVPVRHLDAEHHIRYKGEANGYSVTILKFLHFGQLGPPRASWPGRLQAWLRHWRKSSFDRRLSAAWNRGIAAAVRDIRSWGWQAPASPGHPSP